jgi:hypothetical protein
MWEGGTNKNRKDIKKKDFCDPQSSDLLSPENAKPNNHNKKILYIYVRNIRDDGNA